MTTLTHSTALPAPCVCCRAIIPAGPPGPPEPPGPHVAPRIRFDRDLGGFLCRDCGHQIYLIETVALRGARFDGMPDN